MSLRRWRKLKLMLIRSSARPPSSRRYARSSLAIPFRAVPSRFSTGSEQAPAMFGCVEWTSHPGNAMSLPATGW